ncbi:M56 family metallopeptidase [Gloeobacter violaceus]|uniref:Glr2978 protein n=1 Tax=Gloeobacter violaceus (strain ATCC 29082 / PCC 7421) TaxID=251221 RepID=Q7NCK0_GLOVI|nr:M56 family metallopeptidase [Gloeobacter violaceus]BAC90919.1 glr2978 [Gloeobacter violaceus PCC 7421]
MNSVDALLPLAREVVEGWLNGLWQGALLAAMVWCLLRALRRSTNATTRYVIWWVTLVAVLWLPWSQPTGTSPSVPEVPVEVEVFSNAPVYDLPEVIVRAPRPAAYRQTAAVLPAAAPVGISWPEWSLPGGLWPLVLCAVWLLVAAVRVARVAASYGYLQKLKATSRPFDAAYQARLAEWRRACLTDRRVRLASHPDLRLPVAVGLLDPVILIPTALGHQLTEAEFDQVGLHELAHLRRWDDWTNLVQKTLEAIFFFHPAVWWIGRALDTEREIACDDWVVSVTGRPRPYARCLTRLLELVAAPPRPATGTLAIAGQIRERVALLLDERRPSNPRLSGASLAATVTILVAATALGSQPVIALAGEPDAQAETPSAPKLQPQAAPAPVRRAAAPKPPIPAVAPVPATRPQAAPAAAPPPKAPAPVRRSVLAQAPKLPDVPPDLPVLTVDDGTGKQVIFDGRQLRDDLKNLQPLIDRSVDAAMQQKDLALQAKDEALRAIKAALPTADSGSTRSGGSLRPARKPALSDSERLSVLGDIARSDANPEVRQEAIRAIGRIRGEASVQTLVGLYDGSRDEATRRAILRSLSRSDSPQAAQKMVSIAKSDPDAKMRQEAIRALGTNDSRFGDIDIDVRVPDVSVTAPTPAEPPEPAVP